MIDSIAYALVVYMFVCTVIITAVILDSIKTAIIKRFK